MVSMCPYKWALYAISVWAALYVLLEAAVAWRDGAAGADKPGYEPGPLAGAGGEEDEEDEDEAEERMADAARRARAVAGHARSR